MLWPATFVSPPLPFGLPAAGGGNRERRGGCGRRSAGMADPAPDRLQVASITGIDLEMRIAGLGGRSYAFVIDWHIRAVAALAWFGVSSLTLYQSFLPPEGVEFRLYLLGVLAPAAAIYLLYHLVLEPAMGGRTPGKRIAGVRIVTRDGQTPGTGALLIRNVFRLLDMLPSFYVVGLVAVITTRQSVRIGDLAAGTLLVYDSALEQRSLSGLQEQAVARLGLERMELVRDLLDRWNGLEPAARRRMASKLLGDEAGEATDAELKERLAELFR